MGIALLLCPAIWASAVMGAGPFEFHSNFWLNLHHFLYEQALHSPLPGNELKGAEKIAWSKALDFYRHSMIHHDLLFDPQMQSIDTGLTEKETLPKLVVSGADGGLSETLNSVAPIYRAHWWVNHDEANRRWIAAAAPMARRYSPLLMKQLTAAYEAAWPGKAIRVDLSEYANWAGAYTYTQGWGKIHEIVSSKETANQGYAALEILFHEATHGMVLSAAGRLAERIAAAAKSSGVKTPKDLVHIFIFYTAGELTSRALASDGVNDYIPYADKKGLYRQDWTHWHNSIQVYWKRHLDGSLPLDKAVNQIVAACKSRSAPLSDGGGSEASRGRERMAPIALPSRYLRPPPSVRGRGAHQP